MKLKVTAEVISICHRVCSLSFKRDVPTTTNRVKENNKETKHHSPLLSARRTTKAVCHNYDARVYRHPAYTTRQYHPHIRPQSIVTTPSIKFLHPPPPFQFPNERASTSTQSLSGGRHTTATDPPVCRPHTAIRLPPPPRSLPCHRADCCRLYLRHLVAFFVVAYRLQRRATAIVA